MFERLLAAIARALDAESIPYMVIGGQAVLLHGEPRLTKDIDVTLAAGLERLDTILRAVRAAGLDPLVDPQEFTRRTLGELEEALSRGDEFSSLFETALRESRKP